MENKQKLSGFKKRSFTFSLSFSSISVVMMWTFGKVLVTAAMPSGAEIKLRNRIFSSFTP